MANGVATPKSPNRNAPVANVSLKGKRAGNPAGRSETMADRKVNQKSSNNTSNLSTQNQARSRG